MKSIDLDISFAPHMHTYVQTICYCCDDDFQVASDNRSPILPGMMTVGKLRPSGKRHNCAYNLKLIFLRIFVLHLCTCYILQHIWSAVDPIICCALVLFSSTSTPAHVATTLLPLVAFHE